MGTRPLPIPPRAFPEDAQPAIEARSGSPAEYRAGAGFIHARARKITVMSETTATEAPAASVNGAAPTPTAAADADGGCVECATTAERVMGLVGLLFAVGLAAIAVDLLSGGALSRAAAGLVKGDTGDSDAG